MIGRFLDSRTAISIGFAIACLSVFVLPQNKAHAQWTEPVKLGPNVNGGGTTHFPFVTSDGQRLYLSSVDLNVGMGSNEDIYVCIWDSTAAEWGPRHILDSMINTTERELSPCESHGGTYLWFTRFNGGQSYDLYYSTWDSSTSSWGAAQNAGPQFNSACTEWAVNVSHDSRRMILTHGKRPGNPGCEGEVLWISYWNDTTGWWDSLNWMGNVLNRAAGNLTASMCLDTTYFIISSQVGRPGQPNYGLGDLYRVENSVLIWDSITNLGLPLNSTDRDEGCALSPDGQTLYFASWRDPNRLTPEIYVSQCDMVTDITERSSRPRIFTLSQVYPNPFNASVSVSIVTTHPTHVCMTIYDMLGRRVYNLHDGHLNAGNHRFGWDASKNPSGLYLLRVKSGRQTEIRKLMHMK